MQQLEENKCQVLFMGPNIQLDKDVTMTQNSNCGCHWAISVPAWLMSVSYTGLGVPGMLAGFSPNRTCGTRPGIQEALGEPLLSKLTCGAMHLSSRGCAWGEQELS